MDREGFHILDDCLTGFGWGVNTLPARRSFIAVWRQLNTALLSSTPFKKATTVGLHVNSHSSFIITLDILLEVCLKLQVENRISIGKTVRGKSNYK